MSKQKEPWEEDGMTFEEWLKSETEHSLEEPQTRPPFDPYDYTYPRMPELERILGNAE
jgi:hypothetical protein